jgi:hypothetical protein
MPLYYIQNSACVSENCSYIELNKSGKLHSDSSRAVNLNYILIQLDVRSTVGFPIFSGLKIHTKNFWMNNTEPIMNLIILFSQPHFFYYLHDVHDMNAYF